MVLEHSQFALDGRNIACHSGGVAVLSDQLERHSFAAAADQHRDMRLLDSLGLVDRAAQRYMCPQRLLRPVSTSRESPEPPRADGAVDPERQESRAVGAIFVFVPPRAQTKVEPPVREGIDGARHLRQQRRITIAVAGHI